MSSTPSIREDVKKLIVWLAKGRQICSIYGTEHNMSKETLKQVYAGMSKVLDTMDECTIGIIGNEFAYDKEPFYEFSKQRRDFIDYLKTLGLSRMSFYQGMTYEDLLVFLQALNHKPETEEPIEEIREYLEKYEINTVEVSGIDISGDTTFMNEEIGDINVFTKNKIDESVQFLEETFDGLQNNQPVNMKSLRHAVAGLVNSLLVNKNLLLMLTSIRLNQEDAFVHNMNVCVFTMMQTELLGIDPEYMMDIASSALLHNIGEITYPDDDLKDPNLPFKAVQNLRGAELLLDMHGLSPLAPIVAYEQDLGYDMSGFPEKMSGIDLNMISMIIAIAKYYDQARNKEAEAYIGPEIVYNEMAGMSGQKFHPDLLQNFFTALGVYPPGTLVELSTKEIALVIQASLMDIRRPQVEILYDQSGKKYNDPPVISLLERNNRGEYVRSINRSLAPFDEFDIPDKYTS